MLRRRITEVDAETTRLSALRSELERVLAARPRAAARLRALPCGGIGGSRAAMTVRAPRFSELRDRSVTRPELSLVSVSV